METVKIQDKKTGAVKTVKKSLAGDYIGTGKFTIYVKKEEPKYNYMKKEHKQNEF